MAAAHLSASALGHVLGLGLSRTPPKLVAATLRDRCRIETNRVDGEWTGVSLARYKRLVEHLAQAGDGPAVPLFLRFVWERAESKRCLLDFILALDSHVPCLEPTWRTRLTQDSSCADEWCSSTFSASDTDAASVEAAARCMLPRHAPALRALQRSRSAQHLDPAPQQPQQPSLPSQQQPKATAAAPSFAHSLEVLGAHLCDVATFKPPNALERHAFRGSAPKPDCVEMLLRELFDFLLFRHSTQAFDVQRLPSSASAALRSHYERRASGELTDDAAGADWYPMLQGLDGCRYLSQAPGGESYELHPSLSNLAGAAGRLLGHEGWDSLSQLEAYWNAHVAARDASARDASASGGDGTSGAAGDVAASRPRALFIDESGSGPYRPLLSDHSRMREVASLKLDGSRYVHAEAQTPDTRAYWAATPPSECCKRAPSVLRAAMADPCGNIAALCGNRCRVPSCFLALPLLQPL